MSSQPTERTLGSAVKPLFSLSDGISLYQRQVDHTHRFWNYLWVVSSATVAAAGLNSTSSTGGARLPFFLVAAFIVFAVINLGLMASAHSNAKKTADAINDYLRRNAESLNSTDESFRCILLKSFRRWSTPWPVTAHLFLDMSVIVAVCKLSQQLPCK